MEALQRDVQPVTSIARALHELHKTVENSPAPGTNPNNSQFSAFFQLIDGFTF
jgi:hypothetical protein